MMSEIETQGKGFGLSMETPEDPFIVLLVLRRVLLACGSPFAILPRLPPALRFSGVPLDSGDLELQRPYSIAKLFCARCRHGGVPTPEFLPEEFYLRIRKNQRWGGLKLSKAPPTLKATNQKVSYNGTQTGNTFALYATMDLPQWSSMMGLQGCLNPERDRLALYEGGWPHISSLCVANNQISLSWRPWRHVRKLNGLFLTVFQSEVCSRPRRNWKIFKKKSEWRKRKA